MHEEEEDMSKRPYPQCLKIVLRTLQQTKVKSSLSALQTLCFTGQD